MQRTLKVAVVMGGGWSLGAFTGGAVWELVRQLHTNRNREGYDRCEIDVLAGAGAGALTAAVLFRTLCNPEDFSPAATVARVGEAQRTAWLEGVDFTRLMRNIGLRKASLFDRGAVDELVSELLAWPAGHEARPVLLGRRVLLGMTLLNYNGVPIRRSNTPVLPETISTTRFHDYRVFCFDFEAPHTSAHTRWRTFSSEQVRDADTWHEMAATAVASGAFPIAFEPVVLQRYRAEYGELWPAELDDRDEFPFTYGDAGTFNHQPLREAMDLIAAQDAGETPGSFERVLFFIEPNLNGSKHAFGLKFHLPYMVNGGARPFGRVDAVPSDPAAHLVAITNRFGVLARHQASYADLAQAQLVNARIGWREELRASIHELVEHVSPGDAASTLVDSVESRLTCVLQRAHSVAPGTRAITADDAIARVAFEQTGSRTPMSELSTAERIAYGLMALVDEVADLRDKEGVRLVVVGPTEFRPVDGGPPVPVKLAGDFFANFGGYFDPRFRVHDFEAGRALLGSALAAEAAQLLADAADRPAYTPWSDTPPSLETVPAARDRFVRRIAELTRQLLEYKIGYMGVTQAITIVAHYVAPKLVRDGGAERRLAVVRVEVTPSSADDEFYLAGARGDHGGDARRVRDIVVLHTVLHYSDTEIDGPHANRTASGWALRLVARRRNGRNPFLDIPLPNPALLRANADSGLPIHRIQVDWASHTVSAWSREDALQEWPGGYEV